MYAKKKGIFKESGIRIMKKKHLSCRKEPEMKKGVASKKEIYRKMNKLRGDKNEGKTERNEKW